MLSGLNGTAATTLVTTGLLAGTGTSTGVAWFIIGTAVGDGVALQLLVDRAGADTDDVESEPVPTSPSLATSRLSVFFGRQLHRQRFADPSCTM